MRAPTRRSCSKTCVSVLFSVVCGSPTPLLGKQAVIIRACFHCFDRAYGFLLTGPYITCRYLLNCICLIYMFVIRKGRDKTGYAPLRWSRHPNSSSGSPREFSNKPHHPRPSRPEVSAAVPVIPRDGGGPGPLSGSQLPWVVAETQSPLQPGYVPEMDAETLVPGPGTSELPASLGPVGVFAVGRGLRTTPSAASPQLALGSR